MTTARSGDRATDRESGAVAGGSATDVRLVVVDFGSVGIGRHIDELLAAVPAEAARTRVVDPLLYPWRAEGDVLARHAGVAAQRLLDEGLGSDPGPLVVGQCTGVLFTLELAAALARSGVQPAGVVLVDPVLPMPATVAEHVAALVGRLGGDPRAAEAVVAQLPLDGTLPELTHNVATQLRVLARRRLDGLELDETEAELAEREIVGRYVDWTGFLAAQLARRRSDPGGRIHVLGDAEAAQLDLLRATVAPAPIDVWSAGDGSEGTAVSAQLAQIFAER